MTGCPPLGWPPMGNPAFALLAHNVQTVMPSEGIRGAWKYAITLCSLYWSFRKKIIFDEYFNDKTRDNFQKQYYTVLPKSAVEKCN